MNRASAVPTPAPSVWHWLAGKLAYSVGFGIVVLLLIGAGLFYLTARPTTQVVRIGYGAGGPVRKYFLDQMAIHGKAKHLDIRLVATDGTDQTLSLVDRHAVDLGLIAGAIDDRTSRNVFELAPLYMEPLHLLVREQLFDSVSRDFGQLRGKTIDLDSRNSATNLLATELLRFIGLIDPSTGAPRYRALNIPQADLMGVIASPPDAIFQMGGIPSPMIRLLIADHGYRLVPLPFGGAFNLGKFREAESPEPIDSVNLRLNKSFIEEAVIPAFAYSVLPSVPPGDTRTIATRLLLIGSPSLDNSVVRRVLDLILGPEISGLAKPALTVDLLSSNFQFERHPGTDAYVSSLKPFNLDGAFDAYGKMAEIWGLIITLYFAAAKGLKAWRERNGDVAKKTVGDFLGEILAVEAAAHPSCTDAERIVLDQRLSDIKKQSIELHLEGRLAGAEEFPSLLVTLADTRTRIWGSIG